MTRFARVAIVGERDPEKTAHRGIEASFGLFAREPGHLLEPAWVPTASIERDGVVRTLSGFDGVWCAPGSPYASAEGALAAIGYVRTAGKPFLGTCAGFQHALMEYARDVLHVRAVHAELDPAAADPLIAKLACSLAGATGRVVATRPDLFGDLLGAAESDEQYHCNYGLNPALAGIFAGSPLVFVAHDAEGRERAFRLTDHPFFIGTLFQPERRALQGELHPIVRAFLTACSASPGRRQG